MPLVEYTCPLCQKSHEEISRWPFEKTKPCSTEGCSGTMILGMSIPSTVYKISGDNSCSTPKRKN